MEKIITAENFRNFAYANDNICVKPIRGIVLEFFGGQGSINVNSWHRDSRHIALVLYELEHK